MDATDRSVTQDPKDERGSRGTTLVGEAYRAALMAARDFARFVCRNGGAGKAYLQSVPRRLHGPMSVRRPALRVQPAARKGMDMRVRRTLPAMGSSLVADGMHVPVFVIAFV